MLHNMGYADLLKAIFYVLITWVVGKSQITFDLNFKNPMISS